MKSIVSAISMMLWASILSPVTIMLQTLSSSSCAPLESITSDSLSWNGRYFQKLIYTAKDINRTLLYRKEQVTPELLNKIRQGEKTDSIADASLHSSSLSSSTPPSSGTVNDSKEDHNPNVTTIDALLTQDSQPDNRPSV